MKVAERLFEGEGGGGEDGFDDLFSALAGPSGAEGVFFAAFKTAREVHGGDQSFGAAFDGEGGGGSVFFAAFGVEDKVDLVALEFVFEYKQKMALDGVSTSAYTDRKTAVFSAFSDEVVVIFCIGGEGSFGDKQRAERRCGTSGGERKQKHGCEKHPCKGERTEGSRHGSFPFLGESWV